MGRDRHNGGSGSVFYDISDGDGRGKARAIDFIKYRKYFFEKSCKKSEKRLTKYN